MEKPDMRQEAFEGLAGKVTLLFDPTTESDPVAVLIQFLIGFGNLIGRKAYWKVGATRHHLNLFGVMVGRTAGGRKGTSVDLVLFILEKLEPSWRKECVKSGLSSSEGLIYAVRDPILDVENKVVDNGVEDKRLLAKESEFATVLKQSERQGNTLSDCVRNLWDKGNHQSLTKASPVKTTGAHVSIIGHITSYELRKFLSRNESGNGFANRFLWPIVERSKLLPHGGFPPDDEIEVLVAELTQMFEAIKDIELIERDAEANEYWCTLYEQLTEGREGLFGAVTARAEAQVMRIACLYALLDGEGIVRVRHLRSAKAVWDYCEASAKQIFGDSLGDPTADKIQTALASVGRDGLTLSDIHALFNRNKNKVDIVEALKLLREHGLADFRKVETKGRPEERWYEKNELMGDVSLNSSVEAEVKNV